MTGPSRTGPEREVPPPRPVGTAATAEADGGAPRAARLLADAVSGLLGASGRPADGGPRTAGSLRDVLAAVAAAAAPGRGGTGDAGAPPATPDASWAPGAVLGDLLAAAVPRLPIRDAARLRAAHPAASDEEIADALVQRASRLTAAVGGATGGLSAAHWFAPPSMVALPLELAAETVLTAAVEIVLLGELHELHGRTPAGDARERAAAYLSAWSAQRAVDRAGTTGMGVVLGTAGFRALRRRLGRRMARSVPAAAPFLVGAALGSRGNRKATETLARRVRDDLRRSS